MAFRIFAWALTPMGSRTGPLGLVETPQEHDRDGQEPDKILSRFAWASDDVIELE